LVAVGGIEDEDFVVVLISNEGQIAGARENDGGGQAVVINVLSRGDDLGVSEKIDLVEYGTDGDVGRERVTIAERAALDIVLF